MQHQANHDSSGHEPAGHPSDADRSASSHHVEAGEDELLGVIDQVQSQLNSIKASHTQRDQMRTRLETWDRALAQREDELKAHADMLAGEQTRLEEWKSALETQQQASAAAREQHDRDLQTFSESRQHSEADLETQRNTLREQAELLQQEQHRVEAAAADLAAREERLLAAAGELAQAQASVADLTSRLEQAERAAAQNAEELAAAHTLAQSAGARAETLAADLARAGEAQSGLMAELQRREAQIEEAAAAAGQVEQLKTTLDGTKSQLAERVKALAEANSKLTSAKTKLTEFAASLKEQAGLVAQAQGMAAALNEREREIEQLREQVASARSGKGVKSGGASAAEVATFNARIESLQKEQSELREKLETAQQALALAEESVRRSRAQSESGPMVGGGEIPRDVGETVMRRWNRLRLMRSLLGEQSEKLREAGDVLRARYAECEKILAQRDELARTRAALAETQKRTSTKGDPGMRHRALTAASTMVIALAAILGISWAVAEHVAPATYAARAVLKADAVGAGPDLLMAWQNYHETLVKDPAFIEIAADRMNRQGILSLGTPGLLAERLSTDLTAASPQPGTLTLELRGGGQKTQRELEVFITALAGQSNATRERRSDGLGTVIAESAAAGEPIEDTRLMYAGGIFAGGSGLFGLLSFVLFRRMTAAKNKFEKEHTAVSAEDASWGDAPQVFGRPPRG